MAVANHAKRALQDASMAANAWAREVVCRVFHYRTTKAPGTADPDACTRTDGNRVNKISIDVQARTR